MRSIAPTTTGGSMRIERFDIHQVHLPLSYPWRTGYGADDVVESLLIKAYAPDAEAWVETCPLGAPTYSPETAGGAALMIRDILGPLAVDRELESPATVRTLFAPFRGNSFAKAGVECCWWALEAVRQGVPLRRLFSGKDADVVVRDGFGVQDSVDMLLAKIQGSMAQGHTQIKLKICPGWDLDVLSAVRSEFPEFAFQIDCNGSYSLGDIATLRAFDSFKLEMIEQPLYYRDLADHATLQKQIRTPVCLDESITCLQDAEQALRLQSCRIVNIKIGRVGGIGPALAIHDACQDAGISCWVGGMMESGLGSAMSAEFATLPNCSLPNGIPVSTKFHPEDVVDPPLAFSRPGHIAPAAGPYLGRRVLEDVIEAVTIGKWTVAASGAT